jgi:FMN-dependent NADH-azoreductase
MKGKTMKLLHIDASILGSHSVSRQVSSEVVARLLSLTPGIEVTYRDLAAAPLAHLSGDHLAAAMGAVPESPAMQEDISDSLAVLEEFLAANVVVIGAPMYNFTVPTQLKAWIDRILVAGKTFKYSAEGVEGLAGGKRVVLALSRGGFYGVGMPAAGHEHLESYLRAVFGFIGIEPQVIIAEGIAMGPEFREKALLGATEAVGRLEA